MFESFIKESGLKLSTNWHSGKGFLFLKHCVVCRCPVAMFKSIQICSNSRCQMVVFRVVGPLVFWS